MSNSHSDESEIASAFQKYFPPNLGKHGRYYGVDQVTGKKNVDTREGQPVTLDMVERHLGVSGKRSSWGLGYLPGYAEGTSCGVIDLDEKEFPGEHMDKIRHALLRTCRDLDLAVYLERSSRGAGWHFWLFADAPLKYGVMRDALRVILRHAGIKVEVYPMGDTPSSRWVIMPYRDALQEGRRPLGATWLELDDGQPIPVDELEEYITLNPAERLAALAVEAIAPGQTTTATRKHAIEPTGDELDLIPDAVPLLLEVARSGAPKGGRHDALAAFLNLGRRAGDLPGMVEGLKAGEVLALWCPDGSRTIQDWAAEIDRWADSVQSGQGGQRRGLTYLREEAGYTVPRLPKRDEQVETGLPEIVVNDRQLRDIAADAERALLAANEPPVLFQRGGGLVHLAVREGEVQLQVLDAVALKGRLARVADFVCLYERTEKDETGKKQVVTNRKSARPPMDVAPDLMARTEDLGLPVLRTLAKSPVFGPDGALVSTEGYHTRSKIYLTLNGLTIPALPTAPDALALLRELVTDFPFSHDAGFAHTLAALLLPFIRLLIEGPTPLHLIEAPKQGSGKGLLADVIARVTTGAGAGVMAPTNGDEFEKRVTSLLLEGAPVVLLDNVHTLKGQVLAAAITSTKWKGRQLGRSKMLTLSNEALWLATGNNVELDDDMPRRIIPIRLDPGVERPEERTSFRHPDLRSWVKEHRPELVVACLSLVEAWKAVGRPGGAARLGGFESWAATIGGILEVAGVPGFLTARADLYETANAEPQEWADLLEALYQQHQGKTIGAREVLTAMKALNIFTDYWEGNKPNSALKRVGHAVIRQRDRVFGGFRFQKTGKTATGNAGYRIEAVGRGQNKTPETLITPQPGDVALSSTAFPQNDVPGETPSVPGLSFRNTDETPVGCSTQEANPDGVKSVSGVSGVLLRDSLDVVEL